MDFELEDRTTGVRPTLPEEIDAVYEMEREASNFFFVSAYTQQRHLQVIRCCDEMHLTIWDKQAQAMVGFIILAGLENSHRSLELRRIVVSAKNRGFGRSALRLIKSYCFTQLRFHRLWLDVFTDNPVAIALYAGEGFQLEGTLRDVVKAGDIYRAMHIYSMLEQEFLTEGHT